MENYPESNCHHNHGRCRNTWSESGRVVKLFKEGGKQTVYFLPRRIWIKNNPLAELIHPGKVMNQMMSNTISILLLSGGGVPEGGGGR